MYTLRNFTLAATLISAMVLLSGCGASKQAAADTTSHAAVEAKEELTITAKNFAFDKTEYHIKKDVPVKIVFKNEEGTHGILIPGLEIRLDNKHTSQIVTPSEAGAFDVTCSQYCGAGHSAMNAKIIVE